jgi:hypothetical protein
VVPPIVLYGYTTHSIREEGTRATPPLHQQGQVSALLLLATTTTMMCGGSTGQ